MKPLRLDIGAIPKAAFGRFYGDVRTGYWHTPTPST